MSHCLNETLTGDLSIIKLAISVLVLTIDEVIKSTSVGYQTV